MLEVVDGDADDGWLVRVGDPGVLAMPTAPDTLEDAPCLGVCCRLNCNAFASAFS